MTSMGLPPFRHPRLPSALLLIATCSPAGAASSAPQSENAAADREPTREEIEAYLDSRALPALEDRGPRLEVPPPPPRHRGLVLEASTGAVFHLGALRHVSPPSPWFQGTAGYELADWFMVLANADFTVANTSYAARPPEPRTYVHYAFGAGARFQLTLLEWLAAHAQLELGASQVTGEILNRYGYTDSDRLDFHYGGRLGLEWLQLNPHLALGLQGTFRVYPNLDRINDTGAPQAVIAGLTLRYAF